MTPLVHESVKYNESEASIQQNGISSLKVCHSHEQVLPGDLNRYKIAQLEALIPKLEADIETYKTATNHGISGLDMNTPFGRMVAAATREQEADQALLESARAVLAKRTSSCFACVS